MKKLIVMAATAALLTCISVSSFAAGRSFENKCKAQAEKHKISADKMDAFVKECVEKHKEWVKHKHKKAAMKQSPITEAPTVPATPAEPAK